MVNAKKTYGPYWIKWREKKTKMVPNAKNTWVRVKDQILCKFGPSETGPKSTCFKFLERINRRINGMLRFSTSFLRQMKDQVGSTDTLKVRDHGREGGRDGSGLKTAPTGVPRRGMERD